MIKAMFNPMTDCCPCGSKKLAKNCCAKIIELQKILETQDNKYTYDEMKSFQETLERLIE